MTETEQPRPLYERGVLILTKTRLMTYERCPQYYKLTMIDNLPIEQNIYMSQGEEFHHSAAEFYDLVSLTKLTLATTFDEVERHLVGIVDQFKVSSTVQEWLVNYAQKEAVRFWTYCKKTKDPVKYFMPLTREALYESQVYKVNNVLVKLKGIIDRVDLLPSGKVLLIDYKRHIGNLTVFRKEVGYYQQMFNHVRDNSYSASHVGGYSCTDNTWHIMQLYPSTFRALTQSIERFVVDEVERRFEPKVSDICVYCEMASTCSAWSVT